VLCLPPQQLKRVSGRRRARVTALRRPRAGSTRIVELNTDEFFSGTTVLRRQQHASTPARHKTRAGDLGLAAGIKTGAPRRGATSTGQLVRSKRALCVREPDDPRGSAQ
jgi:hypothetical protein